MKCMAQVLFLVEKKVCVCAIEERVERERSYNEYNTFFLLVFLLFRTSGWKWRS